MVIGLIIWVCGVSLVLIPRLRSVHPPKDVLHSWRFYLGQAMIVSGAVFISKAMARDLAPSLQQGAGELGTGLGIFVVMYIITFSLFAIVGRRGRR